MYINDMTKNAVFIIFGFTLVLITLTNFPLESREGRRQLPQGTYTAIGKLLTCEDVDATLFGGMFIRAGLGCAATEGTSVSLSDTVNNAFRASLRELFMNHTTANLTSSTQSLNYTALGEAFTCEDINSASAHGPSLMKLLGC